MSVSELLYIDNSLWEFAVGKFKAAVTEVRRISTAVGRMASRARRGERKQTVPKRGENIIAAGDTLIIHY